MLESKKMLGEGAKNLLGEKLGTGRLLQRGASFVEKEQSDTGPGAVALGLLVGIVGWTEGGLPLCGCKCAHWCWAGRRNWRAVQYFCVFYILLSKLQMSCCEMVIWS